VHFTRVPRASWARDLAAMRAGGVDVVQVYVIWIHHEEVEGQQDWSGDRDFAAFLDMAQDAGLMVAPRIGPCEYAETETRGRPPIVSDPASNPRQTNPPSAARRLGPPLPQGTTARCATAASPTGCRLKGCRCAPTTPSGCRLCAGGTRASPRRWRAATGPRAGPSSRCSSTTKRLTSTTCSRCARSPSTWA
jgi:hypothetical protein